MGPSMTEHLFRRAKRSVLASLIRSGRIKAFWFGGNRKVISGSHVKNFILVHVARFDNAYWGSVGIRSRETRWRNSSRSPA